MLRETARPAWGSQSRSGQCDTTLFRSRLQFRHARRPNSAAIPALRALDTADTGSPFAKKPGRRNIRRKVRPDIATFARSRQSDLDRSVNFYRDVFECHVALHESEAALLLTPGGFQIYFRAHETPGHAVSTMWASSRSSGPPAAKQNCHGSNNA